MAVVQRSPATSLASTNVADLLERVLDKGVVIAGDIKVSLVDIELLSIQIRLVICSVDKAKEMGMDWWVNHPVFSAPKPAADEATTKLVERLGAIEEKLAALALPSAAAAEQPPAIAPPTVPDWARRTDAA